MKKFTKILSAMLALLLLVSAMAFVTSCKKEEETENTESNNTVSTDESLSTLDIKDMGGREFAMLWPEYISSEGHFMYNELDVESTAGSVIEEAVHTRNIIVKATYNAKIRVDVGILHSCRICLPVAERDAHVPCLVKNVGRRYYEKLLAVIRYDKTRR